MTTPSTLRVPLPTGEEYHTTRHPGVSGPTKLQNFVGDFGRDPVLRNAKLVSFGNITQVDTLYQLDTALRRYDDKAVGVLPTHK